jgi:hypothetical protein
MAKEKKQKLDEATLQIAKRILSMPPKPHKEMKIGKRKAKPPTSQSKPAGVKRTRP